VATRRAEAIRYAAGLAKKGKKLRPVEISGRKIAHTFWGEAWCDNLESYSDYENRLPRGRTYVRNGSVIDLQISAGTVTSLVSGSDIYRIKIEIARLGKPHWNSIKRDCAQSIDSLIDLLQGRFSQGVMERLTRQREGLFPQPKEIKLRCSCPDWAGMCKHVAATLYGVGARLDDEPELLFVLRGVDQLELIDQAAGAANLDRALGKGNGELAGENLGELFGIELESASAASAAAGDADQQEPSSNRKRRRAAPAKAKVTRAKTPAGKGRKTASAAGAKSTRKKAAAKKASGRKPRAKAK
jgi:uncharacterized Zn finger protein